MRKLNNYTKNAIRPLSHTVTKINSKWIKNVNVRSKTVKLLEENIGKKFLDPGLGKASLDVTSNVQATKANIKLKSFCMTKDTVNKMKKATY